MSQDSKESAGFTLPPPADSASAPAAASAPATVSSTAATPALAPAEADTSSRDLLVGVAVLLILYLAFFFVRGAYANTLVAKRVPPNKANAAGWWLFVFLACMSTGVVLAVVNSAKFMAPLIIGPLSLIAIVALVLTFVTGRK
ncbi:hypothetical protein [Duganella qianjiadongensis]|uniref:Integral membrane protein n=1 Tax=Duganella qianjiadongensis TaxID=2692176 RepID=A0ABW9VQJ0_9BURK|nr:hypothetical protein [Duganella qianjiadongensis]MYM40840.1 hypothetical protein [Duganella qianjiadongensis]